MNAQRERAREHFPAVLLGVLGIIQALALEILWETGVGGIDRWRAIGAEASGYLQVCSIFLGIIVVWLMYATTVLRFEWTPRFLDLLYPFLLGPLEFLLVSLTAPERIGAFFAVLALTFVVSSYGTFVIFRSLIAEKTVRTTTREAMLSYVPSGVAVIALLACSALTAATGPTSNATLGCLLLANASLAVQAGLFRQHWLVDLAA